MTATSSSNSAGLKLISWQTRKELSFRIGGVLQGLRWMRGSPFLLTLYKHDISDLEGVAGYEKIYDELSMLKQLVHSELHKSNRDATQGYPIWANEMISSDYFIDISSVIAEIQNDIGNILELPEVSSSKLSWQIQPEMYTFEEFLKVMKSGQVWKVNRIDGSTHNYLHLGEGAHVIGRADFHGADIGPAIYSMSADSKKDLIYNVGAHASSAPFVLVKDSTESSLKFAYNEDDYDDFYFVENEDARWEEQQRLWEEQDNRKKEIIEHLLDTLKDISYEEIPSTVREYFEKKFTKVFEVHPDAYDYIKT